MGVCAKDVELFENSTSLGGSAPTVQDQGRVRCPPPCGSDVLFATCGDGRDNPVQTALQAAWLQKPDVPEKCEAPVEPISKHKPLWLIPIHRFNGNEPARIHWGLGQFAGCARVALHCLIC